MNRFAAAPLESLITILAKHYKEQELYLNKVQDLQTHLAYRKKQHQEAQAAFDRGNYWNIPFSAMQAKYYIELYYELLKEEQEKWDIIAQDAVDAIAELKDRGYILS